MFVPWPTDTAYAVSPFLVLFLAMAIDAAFGDPALLYRAVPHPAALIGKAVGGLDKAFNRGAPFQRIVLGALTVAVVAGGGYALGWAVDAAIAPFRFGWLAGAVFASTFLSWRGLFDHVREVRKTLDQDLEKGRAEVGKIVGRDPETLNEAGVARAAIESLAENFSDGFMAPVFWFALFGLPGIFAYKAVNTLDSMIGHRSERHEHFGKAAARTDDLANLVPARLAGLLFATAAMLIPGMNGGEAWKTMARDASKHRSPNAGWQEAPVAGALGLKLSGPRTYGAVALNEPWIGDGRRDATAGDIARALRLYFGAGGLALVGVAILL